MDNRNNTDKNEEQNEKLTITAKRIFESLSAKVVKCSKRTIKTTSDVMEAILTENKVKIQELCERGLPDDLQMLRALVWKINLGYLTMRSKHWDTFLLEKRNKYKLYKQMFLEKLKNEFESNNYSSKKLLEDITKDVNRTHIEFSFFFQPVSKSKHFYKEELKEIFEKRQNCSLKDIKDIYRLDIEETHADVLARILFIYAKFTPDISYHQGMNEILAPIYYCYSYDKLYIEETEDTIEADTFWSFYYLMADIKSSFDQNDKKGTGFKAEILKQILIIIDKEIYDQLVLYDIKFEFFAYRWFITFFSQDFEMGDLLRLWDLIFSNENKFYYMFYISIALLLFKREAILKNDMAGIMMEVQKFDDINIEALIKLVGELRKKFDVKIKPMIDQVISEEDEDNSLNIKNNI